MARHNSIWRIAFSALGVLAAVAYCNQFASAQYTFIQDTTDAVGNWDDVANWTDGGSNTTYPNAVDATVLINQPIKTGTGLYTLTMPAADVTVGEITIDNTGFSNTTRTWFAPGGGQLIFQATSGTAKYIETANVPNTTANVQNQIQAIVQLNSDLEITQNNYPHLNTGTTFTNLINGSSSRTITKKGIGGIQFNYGFALGAGEGFEGQILIQEGAIRCINSTATISKSSGITVSAGGQLQLADNNAVAVPDYNLASGAILNLNGVGTNAPSSGPQGALRFGITAGRTTTFHNPVVLQSDSVISVGAATSIGVIDQAVSGTGSLTKQGGGTLVLSNASNSYSGDTSLLAGGPLSMTNPFLADGRDVYLVTGSVLDLNFAATDTIRSLYFDGVAQPTGTWGATGSGAAHESAVITGGGFLNVTTLPVMGVPGDYNDNGVVDGADYVLWRHGGPLQNEVDTPNVVNSQDYVEWRARFGNTSGSGSGTLSNSPAVPEPAAATLVAFALSALVAVSRKR